MRKKILIFTAGYFPAKKYGGPPVSIQNLSKKLCKIFDIFVVTSNHDLGDTTILEEISDGWNENEYNSVLYLPDEKLIKASFEDIINEILPDMVYLQSIFDYRLVFPVLSIVKNKKIPTLLSPRGELLKNAMKKKWKKIPYIYLMKYLKLNKNIFFQATSNEEVESINKFFRRNKITVLSNLSISDNKSVNIRKKNSGSLSAVFISRIVPKKNLLTGIKALKKVIGSVTFDIYGPIEDQKYWDECLNQIKDLPENISVTYKGIIDHDDIEKTFCEYDLFIFPTLSENYGHVIAEAINANCPFLTSVNTPWTDVMKYNCSWTIDTEKVESIAQIIQQCINYDNVQFKLIRENLNLYKKQRLNSEELVHKYINDFQELINSK